MKHYRNILFSLGVMCTALPIESASAALKTSDAPESVVLLVRIPLKAESFSAFLSVMHKNVQASRAEPGNISFDAFRPADGDSELVLLEHWKDQGALDIHNDTPHLNAVKAAFTQDAAGPAPMDIARLTEISPPASRKPILSPETTRNVIAIFHVKPEAREEFEESLLRVVSPSRNASGNLQFDVFEDQGDKNCLRRPEIEPLVGIAPTEN